jgi:catalase
LHRVIPGQVEAAQSAFELANFVPGISFSPDKILQARLIGNIVASMRTVARDIQARQIQHFFKADPKYGQRVAEGLGQKLEEVLTSKMELSEVR